MLMFAPAGATRFIGRGGPSVHYETTATAPIEVPLEDIAIAHKNGWAPVLDPKTGVPVP